MARTRQHKNGRLEEALATGLLTQASMQQTIASVQQNQATMRHTRTSFLAQMAGLKAESDRRFARIGAALMAASHHTQGRDAHAVLPTDPLPPSGLSWR